MTRKVFVIGGGLAGLSAATILASRGASVTVQVTSTTDFGTPTRSENASDFAVGQEVVVLGSRSGDTVTAVRVLGLSAFKSPGQTNPESPTPSPSK